MQRTLRHDTFPVVPGRFTWQRGYAAPRLFRNTWGVQTSTRRRDLQGPVKNANFRVQTFFVSKTRNECDFNDVSKQPLFDRALGKLGKLEPNEVYGFEPALVAGGQMDLDHLKKG
ncbi:T6SS immunity protein Tdi1 domain-containing protein [Burkholderia cepacia]|uniref:T6SS immunity protein Tdi1 domain-containing protein n=1 Tax=Burkholderia cepacia TaxID=292 RepID=UPI00398E4B7A